MCPTRSTGHSGNRECTTTGHRGCRLGAVVGVAPTHLEVVLPWSSGETGDGSSGILLVVGESRRVSSLICSSFSSTFLFPSSLTLSFPYSVFSFLPFSSLFSLPLLLVLFFSSLSFSSPPSFYSGKEEVNSFFSGVFEGDPRFRVVGFGRGVTTRVAGGAREGPGRAW